MKLIDAFRTGDNLTENGMKTNSTSLNMCVDLFYNIGSIRGVDYDLKLRLFTKAFNEDPLKAMKILFWLRDIRGGAGERGSFRDIISYLGDNHPIVLNKNIELIPEYGRWDDLLSLFGTKSEKHALDLIKKGLEDKNDLCAKWLPRGNTKSKPKRKQANIIRKFLKLTPKEYRKLLVNLSNTVEQKMCSNNFGEIDYSRVPSKAMSDYMNAFGRRDSVRFSEFLNKVELGKSKINVGAIYPYDIIKNLKLGDSQGANVQWDSLPNYMLENKERVLPLVDVSDSMMCSAGGSSSISCLDVAISLGLYISERNEGPFKDSFLTFTTRPKLEYLKGSLSERYSQLSASDWGGSTNIENAYKVILEKALKFNIKQNEMPTTLIILSDMEFDMASSWDLSNQELVDKLYKDYDYELPKIVYWNINGRNGNSPVSFDESGTALVSGFSPGMLKSVLSGEDMTPIKIMNRTIESERYSVVKI